MNVHGITQIEMGRLFDQLYNHFRKPYEHKGRELEMAGDYAKRLSWYPPDAVRAGVDRCIGKHTGGFPKVAELRAFIDACVDKPKGAPVTDDGPPKCPCGRVYEWLSFQNAKGEEFGRSECREHYSRSFTLLDHPAQPREVA